MEIARGAEAVLVRTQGGIAKRREPKAYRHPLIDERLREQRTRAEARALVRAKAAGVRVPEVLEVARTTLLLEHLEGNPLSQEFSHGEEIGKMLGTLHDAGIIHGDPTTSNMIVSEAGISLIDFGLSYHSMRIEDRAVDLHLLRQSLESNHPGCAADAFAAVLVGYRASPDAEQTIARLEKVGARGRNKR